MSKLIPFVLCATGIIVNRSFSATSVMTAIRSVDFEVFGKVQGVFFRKNTQQHANELGLRGWCKNTKQGTVAGSLQGPSDKVQNMMEWLRTKGSPNSEIEKAEFKNDKEINDYTYKKFEIVRD